MFHEIPQQISNARFTSNLSSWAAECCLHALPIGAEHRRCLLALYVAHPLPNRSSVPMGPQRRCMCYLALDVEKLPCLSALDVPFWRWMCLFGAASSQLSASRRRWRNSGAGRPAGRPAGRQAGRQDGRPSIPRACGVRSPKSRWTDKKNRFLKDRSKGNKMVSAQGPSFGLLLDDVQCRTRASKLVAPTSAR